MNSERTHKHGRRAWWLVALVLLALWSARGSGVDVVRLLGEGGREQMVRFARGLFPPELSADFLVGLVQPAIESIQMSLFGALAGAVIAAPLAALAARPPGGRAAAGDAESSLPRRAAYAASRGLLNVMRTIPDLVWALMFIAAVGLGPFAGVLALTVHSAGLLGKLYAEALESVDSAPVDSLRATGAGSAATLLFGVLPQASSPLVSVTLYQWECNIRAALVLGFVGAGGIGQRIDLAMRLFRYDELLTLMVVLFVLVTAVDRLSAALRARIMTSGR